MHLYPMMFKPILKEMVWGGQRLKEKFGRELPSAFIGESWEISCRENDMSFIENGKYSGKTFIEVLESAPEKYLGTDVYSSNYRKFPLLISIIDANKDLSVQVHPTDEFAIKFENEVFGKSEMWYVAEAPENATIVFGFNDGVSKEKLKEALKKGEVKKLLNRLPVKRGDIVNIPAGLVHAITAGVMIFEVQQNVNITYRLYDYGRLGLDGKPRELHIEKAMDVIDFTDKYSKETIPGLQVLDCDAVKTYYIASEYYAIEKLSVNGKYKTQSNPRRFHLLTCVTGSCKIELPNEVIELDLSRTVFIPACMGEFKILGTCELLVSYVPDITDDFIKPLKNSGYSDEQISLKTQVMFD